jgi:two-component system, chemotaxis family, sensor kinase CheA
VIIVTSLHSDEHKRQGIVAGAQAYIVKSQFDQSNLLSAVRDLLGAAP